MFIIKSKNNINKNKDEKECEIISMVISDYRERLADLLSRKICNNCAKDMCEKCNIGY